MFKTIVLHKVQWDEQLQKLITLTIILRFFSLIEIHFLQLNCLTCIRSKVKFIKYPHKSKQIHRIQVNIFNIEQIAR